MHRGHLHVAGSLLQVCNVHVAGLLLQGGHLHGGVNCVLCRLEICRNSAQCTMQRLKILNICKCILNLFLNTSKGPDVVPVARLEVLRALKLST